MNKASLQIDAGIPLPEVHDDYVQTPVGELVIVYPLGVAVDLASRGWELTLLNNPQGGVATVTVDGAIKFAPAPGFVGAATIHFLIEDQQHNDVSATVTVEVQNHFAFKSRTSSNGERVKTNQLGDEAGILARKVFSVAAGLQFAGTAAPSAELIGRLYKQCGALAGESMATADAQGRWETFFGGTKELEFYRFEIESLATAAGTLGTITLQPNESNWQAM